MRSEIYQYDRIIVEKTEEVINVVLEKDIHDSFTGEVTEVAKRNIDVGQLADRITVLSQEIEALKDLRDRIDLKTSYISPEGILLIAGRVKRDLEKQTQDFIQKKEDGKDRYTWFHGITFLNLKFSFYSIPENERPAGIVHLLSRILEVELWQGAVYSYLNDQLIALTVAETIDEVRGIENGFDLSVFEESDPDVFLAEFSTYM